ncbi:MAG TPA: serpin family protein [candidate division Zixibacteria bacterium]
MFNKWKIILVPFITIIFLYCSKCPTKTVENTPSLDLSAAEKSLLKSDNKFGFKLFQEVVKEEKDKNVFISPLSVSMALGMTYNGANGNTQEAMKNTLELNGLTLQEVNESYQHLIKLFSELDPNVLFQIANSIWYRQGWTFEEEFIQLNKTYFNALVSGLNFDDPHSADVINAWVNENTKGKITEIIIPPIDPSMVMFLINAIYFKGTWTYQFDKSATREWPFLLPDNSTKPCQMMGLESEFPYYENDDFQAVNLPYGKGDYSMIVFLPKWGENVDSLIAKLSQENFDLWLSEFHSDSGKVCLPKFTLEYGLKLNDALKALGMSVAFDPGQADFSRMFQGKGLFISDVKHKTFVEVNEEGTEAAAVTSVGIAMSALPPPLPFEIVMDRPFVFLIRENLSGAILFMGKIVEPTL